MLISTRGRYALRILTDIAEHQTDSLITLQEVAKRQEISEKYLESIVRDLVKSGIIAGQRGKGGGYRLCKSPDLINVGDILRITEGSLAPVACLEDNASPCARSPQCRTLEFWRGLDEEIYKYTHRFTLADIMWNGRTVDDYVI